MGVAMPVGFLLAGKLGQIFNLDEPEKANCRGFFFVAAAAMAVLLVIYWFSARVGRNESKSANGPNVAEIAPK
jgi:hypothetical protein